MQDQGIPLGFVIVFILGVVVGRFLTLIRAGFRKKPGEARIGEFIRRLDRMRSDQRAANRLVAAGDRTAHALLLRIEFELDDISDEASRVRADIIKGI